MHFMNPVPVMQLVELIRGIATDDEPSRRPRASSSSSARPSAVAEDFPAFIVNRILLPMINEAVYTLYEGVGTVEAIDTAMRLGANHPMGPLELADFIGLDTCLSVMQVLYEGLADSKYRPCPLLVKYVEAGWLGRKTRPRLLRLPRREAGPDALSPPRRCKTPPPAWSGVAAQHQPVLPCRALACRALTVGGGLRRSETARAARRSRQRARRFAKDGGLGHPRQGGCWCDPSGPGGRALGKRLSPGRQLLQAGVPALDFDEASHRDLSRLRVGQRHRDGEVCHRQPVAKEILFPRR